MHYPPYVCVNYSTLFSWLLKGSGSHVLRCSSAVVLPSSATNIYQEEGEVCALSKSIIPGSLPSVCLWSVHTLSVH